MKNRLPFALLAASALVLAGCSSINTALNTSKQPSMEKLTPPSGQPSCPVKDAPPSGRATPPARHHRPPHPARKRYRPYRQKAAPYHMYRYRSSPQMRRTPLSSVRAGSPRGRNTPPSRPSPHRRRPKHKKKVHPAGAEWTISFAPDGYYSQLPASLVALVIEPTLMPG